MKAVERRGRRIVPVLRPCYGMVQYVIMNIPICIYRIESYLLQHLCMKCGTFQFIIRIFLKTFRDKKFT